MTKKKKIIMWGIGYLLPIIFAVVVCIANPIPKERPYHFLLSILALVGIYSIFFLFVQVMSRKYNNEIRSIEWIENNQRKLYLVAIVKMYISGPAIEEVLHRAVLIMAFPVLSGNVWPWIIASSIIFSAAHFFFPTVLPSEIFKEKESGAAESDDYASEYKRLEPQKRRRSRIVGIIRVVIVFPIGALFAYVGIKYQSLWLAFGVHAGWNLFAPFVLALLALLVVAVGWIFSFIGIGIGHLFKDVKDKLREIRGVIRRKKQLRKSGYFDKCEEEVKLLISKTHNKKLKWREFFPDATREIVHGLVRGKTPVEGFFLYQDDSRCIEVFKPRNLKKLYIRVSNHMGIFRGEEEKYFKVNRELIGLLWQAIKESGCVTKY